MEAKGKRLSSLTPSFNSRDTPRISGKGSTSVGDARVVLTVALLSEGPRDGTVLKAAPSMSTSPLWVQEPP